MSSSTIEIVARSTASLSIVSSAVIIYLILLSRNGLSNAYHRILFGMSIFDIIGSTAIALTTLPMPTDYDDFEIPWSGKRLGNAQTCTAQGYFVYFLPGAVGYNALLSVYYLHIIGLQKNFGLKLEIGLHCFVWVATVVAALIPIIAQTFFRPGPLFPWCAPAGGGDKKSAYQKFVLTEVILGALCFITCIGCLIFVSFRVVKRNNKIRKMIEKEQQEQQQEEEQDRDHDPLQDEGLETSEVKKLKKLRRDTNIVLVQSACYVLALTNTVVALMVPIMVIRKRNDTNIDLKNRNFWVIAVVLLCPLQGFFDCLIFVGSKIVTLRNANPDMTICDALKRLFAHRIVDPMEFSNLSMVDEEIRKKELEYVLRNMADNGGEFNGVRRAGVARYGMTGNGGGLIASAVENNHDVERPSSSEMNAAAAIGAGTSPATSSVAHQGEAIKPPVILHSDKNNPSTKFSPSYIPPFMATKGSNVSAGSGQSLDGFSNVLDNIDEGVSHYEENYDDYTIKVRNVNNNSDESSC